MSTSSQSAFLDRKIEIWQKRGDMASKRERGFDVRLSERNEMRRNVYLKMIRFGAKMYT